MQTFVSSGKKLEPLSVEPGRSHVPSVQTTIFFGMNLATILGIFLIPALYVLFQGMVERITGRIGNKPPAPKA